MKNQQSLFGRPITSIIDAIEVIELDEGNEADHIAAWQYLIDTGTVWQMQGVYGRTAALLIDEGICSPPDRDSET